MDKSAVSSDHKTSPALRPFEPHTRDVPYQASLRAIGEYLDAEHSASVRVVEMPSGFAVFSESREGNGQLGQMRFEHGELYTLASGAHTQRKFGRRNRYPSDSHYQDLFRALGYELEDACAYLIVLDESSDGLLLSYQQHDRGAGITSRKRYAVFSGERVTELLCTAVARRN